MFGSEKPRFLKPASTPLYPSRNKEDTAILINPNSDVALTSDEDAQSSFVYNRHHHLPLEAQRQRLPVFQYRTHILYLLEKYQTLVLVGETGSGKSTQVPQYAYEIGHKVCVTQPRVAAAVSLASRVSDERGDILGATVGYSAGMMSLRSIESGIVFMTEGALLREVFASPLLMQYTCIVLDEVHERTQMTDVVMGLLKKIARKRKNLKIVVSSATMDAEFLRDFFNLKRNERGSRSTSVILTMQGRVHPIDVYYLEDPTPDYVKATVSTVMKIHENEPFGDVLAFLTSQEEIHAALDVLTEYAEENNLKNLSRKKFASGMNAANLSILPMYGSLAFFRQIKVFQMAEKGVRKVILATNIAETSVTIPGIVYVIDCGYHKMPFYEVNFKMETLVVTPISKNNAIQRAGRAGRMQKGKCYRLYTEAEYEKLSSSVPPEMLRSDLSSVLLQLKALGIHNLLRFTFPTPPPAKCLLAGIELLYALQALDKTGALTTDIGEKMAELPLKPMCAKMLCSSGEFGCINEALTIVSMLQVDNVFVKPSARNSMAAKVCRRNNFEVAEGDIIMYLNIYDAYSRIRLSQSDKKSKKACKDWCNRMYINYRVMEKATEIRENLEKLIKNKFKIVNKIYEEPDLGTGKCIRIMKCVVSAFFSNAAHLNSTSGYRTLNGATTYLSPDSCLYRTTQPQW